MSRGQHRCTIALGALALVLTAFVPVRGSLAQDAVCQWPDRPGNDMLLQTIADRLAGETTIDGDTGPAVCQARDGGGRRTNDCAYAFNGRCDEPGIGTGRCERWTDSVDCTGRTTTPGAFEHFFGRDDRVRPDSTRMPWSAIGRLELDSGTTCSAALIGPNIGLTAAHCFFDGPYRARAEEFQAGLHGRERIGRARVVAEYIAPGYDPELHGSTDDINGLDWAFFALDRDLGEQAGSFQLHYLSPGDVAGILAGGWFPISQGGYSWDSANRLTAHVDCPITKALPDNTILHQCDMTWGDSGSPFFFERDGAYHVVAIVSKFYENPNPSRSRSFFMAVDSRAFEPHLAAFLDTLNRTE